MARSSGVLAVLSVAALLLAGCSGTGDADNADGAAGEVSVPEQGGVSPDTEAAPEPEPELSGKEIAEWVTGTDWSFAPQGLLEPVTITLTNGEASDDLGRTYELGEFVESDANGDGIIDIAIPITEFDGNGVTVLWYVWLGNPDGLETGTVATQMMYPIARMTRCGDAVMNVTATEQGFAVEETLRHPLDPGDCVTGGTWHQTRELHVVDIDENPYPILTSPVHAWGGVCPVPTLDWLDGEMMNGIVVRSAPHQDAPVIFTEDDSWGVFGLPEAPLMTASGASFFGFMPNEYASQTPEEIAATPVRTHCAFAEGAA